MTNQEILQRAIEKAEYLDRGLPRDNAKFKDYGKYDWECLADFGYYELIFSHDFAKAFFGEDEMLAVDAFHPKHMLSGNMPPTQPEWQYHLQQLVLEKEPLKYLEKFLK